MSRPVLFVLASCVALGLIVLLVLTGDIGAEDLLQSFAAIPVTHLFLIVAATAGQMLCSALKWRLTLRRIDPEAAARSRMSFFLFYTCLASGLSQLVTVYISSVAVRGIAARHHQDTPFLKGAASSGFEQAVDVLVMLLLLIPTAVILLFGGDLVLWAVLAAISIFLGAGILPMAAKIIPAFSERSGRISLISKLRQLVGGIRAAGLLAPDLLLSLYGLSVIRYACMLARTLVVAIAGFAMFPVADVVHGFTVVQASQLAAVTPGNLGISEWSWTGMLAAVGANFGDAARFAIVVRILTYGSIVPVLLIAWMWFSGPWVLKRIRRAPLPVDRTR